MHNLDKLMNSVVRIEAHLIQGGIATGTGFAYQFTHKDNGMYVPAIVTNKHVINGANVVSLPISVADKVGNPTGKFEVITLNLNEENIIYHLQEDVDLCAILTATIYNYFEQKGLQPALISLDKAITASEAIFAQLLPLEEVTMIGFPNGIQDSVNNGSIARRGVIATIPKNDYLGKKQFVIDMACFPSSSGSPVFLANFGSYADRNGSLLIGTRIQLLGILYAGPQYTASGEIVLTPVPTQNKPMSLTSMPNNLGYVIKGNYIPKSANSIKPFMHKH